MKMREIAEGIYEVILHDKEKEVGEMRVHIVKGKPGKRSLMVDTGFGSQESLEDMEEALIFRTRILIFSLHISIMITVVWRARLRKKAPRSS